MIFYMQVINIYDLILELTHNFWKNGLSISAIGTAVYVLLKQRKVKKRLKKYVPYLLTDEEVNQTYVNNQKIIMDQLKEILKGQGITWTDSVGSSEPSIQKNLMKSSTLLLEEKNMQWKNKWKSRRFLLAVLGAVLVIVNEFLDLNLSPESQATVVAILISFILGESAVDAKRASKGEQNEKYPSSDDAE